ncbi:serine/threonine-protein kinase VRK1-like isoform X2 [Branchiostoma lanceolatum]|uniref:serine/threonine-protein kinase VRK1-like isoform X2 n=1 Tax=Branchiostoma lanceolatum TaxID=7740 RepID=UPI003455FE06
MPPVKKQVKKRAPPKHKLPDPLKPGEVLTDSMKRQWKVGAAVGQGGFGLLYAASPNGPDSVGPNAEYVIKIEPHDNGPLFSEINFYLRTAKQDMIKDWMKAKKMKHLGVPRYIGSGSHEGKTRLRFMVMERFGENLHKMFEAAGKVFTRRDVAILAIRLLNTLEYLHDHQFVHADIKGSNLLMGFTKDTQDQVYLVDYGLAYRYLPDSGHRDYKEDPRKAHDGTPEFTSSDAHKGVPAARRGDIEILGYVLLQWLRGQLPWEDNLTNCDYLRDQKMKYLKNIPSLLKACFPKGDCPDELRKYLEYTSGLVVNSSRYQERPDYNYLRGLFTAALKKAGWKDDGKFDFLSAKPKSSKKGQVKSSTDEEVQSPLRGRSASPKKRAPPKKKAVKRKSDESDVSSPPKKKAAPRKKVAKRVYVDSDSESPSPKPKAAKAKAAKARKAKSPDDSDSDSPPKPKTARGKATKSRKAKSPASKSPKPKPAAKRGRKARALSTIATQTSPGLMTRGRLSNGT